MRRLAHHVAMAMAFAVVILTLLMTSCRADDEGYAPHITYNRSHTVGTIVNSPGGYVEDFLAVREILRDRGVTLKIVGDCDSACTLFTDLPKACVYQFTRLGFHKPFYIDNGKKVFDDQTTREFFAQYPPKIQRWLAQHGGLQADLVYLEGKQLLDLMPLCNGGLLPK